MTTKMDRRSSLSLHEILEVVKSLPPDDQIRLRNKLASLTRIYIETPDTKQTAMQHGQELADQLRSELASASWDQLEQVMSMLRGRMWLS